MFKHVLKCFAERYASDKCERALIGSTPYESSIINTGRYRAPTHNVISVFTRRRDRYRPTDHQRSVFRPSNSPSFR